jgi:hypothetical protein
MLHLTDFVTLASIIISIFAVSVSLLGCFKEGRIQRQAGIAGTLTDIVDPRESDMAVESCGKT